MAVFLLALNLLLSLNLRWSTLLDADYIFDYAERDGKLFLATNGGVILYDAEGDSVVRQFTNMEGLPGPIVKRVLFDGEGYLWAAVQDKGLAYLPPEDDFFQAYPLSKLPASAADIRDMVVFSDTLFLATDGGLVLLDTHGTGDPGDDFYVVFTSYYYPLSSDDVYGLGFRNDTLFVGTAAGLDYVPAADLQDPDSWRHFDGFEEGDTVHIVEPGRNFIGLAVNDRALYVTNDTTYILVDSLYISDLLCEGDTLYITAFDRGWGGQIWLTGGVFLTPGDGSLIALDRTSSIKKRATSIYIDSGSRIWAGFGWCWNYSIISYGAGLGKLEGDTWRIKRLTELNFNKITSIERDDSGTVWVAQCIGYYPYGVQGFKRDGTTVFTDSSDYPNSPYRLVRGPDGRIWAGTWWSHGGVYRIDFDGSILLHNNGFISNYIKDIAFLEDGTPLVACYPDRTGEGGGVYRLIDDSTSELYTDIVTMMDDIEIDDEGRLWIGGAGGCVILGTDTVNLRMSEGLPSDNVIRLVRDGDAMWIGTSNGLALFRNGVVQATFLEGYEIRDVDPSPDGKVFVLTDQGLAVLYPEENRVLAFYTPENSPLISDLREGYLTNALLVDAEAGKIWVGTKHGLNIIEADFFEKTKEGAGPYVYPNPWIEGASGQRITVADIDVGGEIYLYTLSGKKIDLNGLEFTKRGRSASFNPGRLAPGTYLLLVRGEDGTTRRLKFAVIK